MKRLLLSVLFGLCSLCFFTSVSLADSFPKQAIAIAETLAATMDSRSYQAAYMSGAELLRIANSEQAWIDHNARTHQLLGTVQHRELKAARSVTAPPGFPDGNYLLVYYEAQTERKSKAAEVILVGQHNGTWAVYSYAIR